MKRVLVLLGLLVSTGAASWFCLGAPQVRQEAVPVTSLLPERSIVMLQVDGHQSHRPAIEQTAAWKSLEETGMRARIFDLLELFVSTQDANLAPEVRKMVDGLLANGFSAAAAISSDGRDFAPYGIVVLHKAASMLPTLTAFVLKADPQLIQKIQTRTVEGRSVSFVAPGPPGVQVAWWLEGEHLVVTGGINPVDRVIETIQGKAPDVTRHPLWKGLRASDRFNVDHLGWIDTKSLLDQFGEMPFPNPPSDDPMSIREFVDLLGCANLKALTFCGGYRNAETWSQLKVVAPGPRTRLLKLLDQRQISFDELPPMPVKTDNLMAFAFDIRKAVDLVMESVQASVEAGAGGGPDSFAADFARFQEVIGGHPRDVFSAGLGDLFCIYNDPVSMPIPMGIGPVFAASVQDQTVVQASLSRLFELVKATPNAERLNVKQTQKDGVMYYSLQISGVPIVPTILVSDKWMVLSLMPGAAQSFASRLGGKLPSWKPSEAVTAALADLPSTYNSIAVSDPAPGYQSMMMWAPMALGLLETEVLPGISRGGNPVQMPFGIQDLPSSEELTDPMFPNVTVTVISEDGVTTYARQSVPGIPVGNVGSVAAVPILIALLLPAVQQAREAARRTASQNNLKQLGLAMHNYHDTHHQFPQGAVENPNLPLEQRLSWVAPLLPYVEQAAIYNALDQKAAWNSDTNKQFAAMTVPMFQNPSQPRRNNSGALDYVGISGIGPKSAELPGSDVRAGIFGYNRQTKIRDITDGTSNTLAIADAAPPQESFLKAEGSIRGFSQKPYVNGPDGIGSPHTGGFQAVLGDGSVRFISENIDPKTLEALATMHGGEVVELP